MSPIAIALKRVKINRKIIIYSLIFLLALIVVISIAYFQREKIGELNLALLLGKLTAIFEKKEASLELEEVLVEEVEEIPVVSQVYEEEAQAGEGITHLARKSLTRYLEEKGTEFNLTPEHKIYIEDYIQNKTGDRLLSLGEKITISQDLIVEGIDQAKKLTPEQLENLKQYSALVSSL